MGKKNKAEIESSDTDYVAQPPFLLTGYDAETSVSSLPSPSPPPPTFEETFEGVARLLRGRKNIIVLVGAGISTSCGIPDFRSRDSGLYHSLDLPSLGLSEPEDLFCIEFFKHNPAPFYRFARNLYHPPGTATTAAATTEAAMATPMGERGSNAAGAATVAGSTGSTGRTIQPSDSHKLLALLEKKGMLLRVYTQNIDGLEYVAGVSEKKTVYVHGSLRYVTGRKGLFPMFRWIPAPHCTELLYILMFLSVPS
jgi:NAD+-dependent protein deacetylase SIR2